MLEFAAGAVFGACVAGIAAGFVFRSLRADIATAAQRENRATERTVHLLAANQSEAIRRAVGSDSTEDVLRREEEDRRFKMSFQSSD